MLELTSDEETKKIWNHSFVVEYVVTLNSNNLVTELVVINTDSQDFTFTCCLHTYFRVTDIAQTYVEGGFKGLTYTDKVKGGAQAVEDTDRIIFSGETDRVYYKVPAVAKIVDKVGSIQYQVEKVGFEEYVIWNPWEVKSKEMADLGEGLYKKMVE